MAVKISKQKVILLSLETVKQAVVTADIFSFSLQAKIKKTHSSD
jgi:hypothetical protein